MQKYAESQPLFSSGIHMESTFLVNSMFDVMHLAAFVLLPPLYCSSTQPDLYLFSLFIYSYFDWLILASHLLMTHISNPENVSEVEKIMLICFQSLY